MLNTVLLDGRKSVKGLFRLQAMILQYEEIMDKENGRVCINTAKAPLPHTSRA